MRALWKNGTSVHRDDDHRDRQRVVELQEAHAVVVGLPRGADHRDGAELRRHHRQADGPPGQAAAGQEVALDLGAVLGEPDAVPDNPGQVGGDDEPVERVHRDVLSRLEREPLLEGPEGQQHERLDDEHAEIAPRHRGLGCRSRRWCHQRILRGHAMPPAWPTRPTRVARDGRQATPRQRRSLPARPPARQPFRSVPGHPTWCAP